MAHMTRKAISEDSIYTLKLARRGHVVPEGLQAAVHAAQRVQDVMTSNFRILGPGEQMSRYGGVTLVRDTQISAGADTSRPTTGSIAPLPNGGGGGGGGGGGCGGGGGGGLAAACAPVLINYQEVFGRMLTAREYATASGEMEREVCIVASSDDLNDAIRRMVRLNASVLLVSRFSQAYSNEKGLSRGGSSGTFGTTAAAACGTTIQERLGPMLEPPAGGSGQGMREVFFTVADVVGVVTKSDISKNLAAKSELMSRDRTLGTR